MKSTFNILSYHDFVSPALAHSLLASAKPISGIPGLKEVGSGGGLETTGALRFLVNTYLRIENNLAQVLAQRTKDRRFIDERVRACYLYNKSLNIDFLDPDYQTVLNLEDGNGRIVFGPKSDQYCKPGGTQIAPVPDFMQGPHVTLFGPPDSAKMAVNAMNAYHRKLPGEPAIVAELLSGQMASPTWGADDEDSKTPLRKDLIDAAVNLTACFNGTIKATDERTGKNYELARDHLAQPMKRFPGLALPCTFLFFEENPIPLHLYDFCLHLAHNWHNPKALVFYVPKLENEEEAAYIHHMIYVAESEIKELHPAYVLGTVRVMIVLENPRAILRAHEMIDALYPYFMGASLGWHDFLASTARIFKEDANYRIPVKADPNIVIKYIKASHMLLADVVGSRGGIKVGGMYGLLPQDTDIASPSFQITLKGFFKDIVTQLKRDLTGFWVAHPDFVRLGLAIVESWRLYQAGDQKHLFALTKAFFTSDNCKEVNDFIAKPDIEGLIPGNPNYARSLLVADMRESDFVQANHPDEIRYNVFQSLQYLTDWLSGNGCVALPTIVDGIPVRVMDDLATAERSRWEVWHEIYHGRFPVEDFIKISYEELHFIRKDLSNAQKIVQVKWDDRTAKWYPVALRIMMNLMTASRPAEFATELLLPFTIDTVQSSEDPWTAVIAIDSEKFRLARYIERFAYYFERCGNLRFATELARNPVLDLTAVETLIRSFSMQDVLDAAWFHGDIGEGSKTLDPMASREQALVQSGENPTKLALYREGKTYLQKFGFKFLISAQDKDAPQLLAALRERLQNSPAEELENAKVALWEITRKRLVAAPLDTVSTSLEALKNKHAMLGISLALCDGFRPQTHCPQTLCYGKKSVEQKTPVTPATLFEIASLSKTFAAAFAHEFFAERGIPLTAKVNALFAKTNSLFRLQSGHEVDPSWADLVTIADLLSHRALNMHYVRGIKLAPSLPRSRDFLSPKNPFGYETVTVMARPGGDFHYSGGGFLVLEHLIESLTQSNIQQIIDPWLKELNLQHTLFDSSQSSGEDVASGTYDSGEVVPGGRLMFPAFAAGALSTPGDMLAFLQKLERAFHRPQGVPGLSHDTAVQMLFAKDQGSKDFMGCKSGQGVFVIEAGENRMALHQGANEGFRALYLHTFAGPDRGKGFVILLNGDNNAVLCIAETARLLLEHLEISGIDYDRLDENLAQGFQTAGKPQEQIVNLGYKQLLFAAFTPARSEEIIIKGPKSPLGDFNVLLGARVLHVTSDLFARAENLISPWEPVFDPELFGAQGKIMDSWESVRHNPLPLDQLDLQMKNPSNIQYVLLSTKYHDGNQAPVVALWGRPDEHAPWEIFLPNTNLLGHAEVRIKLPESTKIYRDIRVQMIPDGGLSRLGLFCSLPANSARTFEPLVSAKPRRFSEIIPRTKKPLSIPYSPTNEKIAKNKSRAPAHQIDYCSLAFGGKVLAASDEHYSPAVQVISPFEPLHMFDGMESARSRSPGHHDEVTIELGEEITPKRIEFDFRFFVNNNPRLISVDAWNGKDWIALIPQSEVKAYAGNTRTFSLKSSIKTNRLRIQTHPDGGINRVRVYSASLVNTQGA